MHACGLNSVICIIAGVDTYTLHYSISCMLQKVMWTPLFAVRIAVACSTAVERESACTIHSHVRCTRTCMACKSTNLGLQKPLVLEK